MKWRGLANRTWENIQFRTDGWNATPAGSFTPPPPPTPDPVLWDNAAPVLWDNAAPIVWS